VKWCVWKDAKGVKKKSFSKPEIASCLEGAILYVWNNGKQRWKGLWEVT